MQPVRALAKRPVERSLMPAKSSEGVVIPFAFHAGFLLCRYNETSAETHLEAQNRKAKQ